MPAVETNDVQTYYEESGSGPPIVFLHGGRSDHRIWAEQMQPLMDFHRVIVYDLRGHGKTGGSDQETYTIETYADDLHAFVEELDLDDPIICGLSLGGMVAITYAAKYPGESSGVVTVGTVTPEILSTTGWLMRRGMRTIVDGISVLVDPETVSDVVEWGSKKIFGEEVGGDLDKADEIRAEHAEEYPEIADHEVDKMSAAVTGFPSESVDLSAIRSPSLHLYGENELGMMKDHAEHMEEQTQQGTAKQIPEAGHNSHVDNPEFIVESIQDFAHRVN